jgi:AraC family transcriptional regulator
MTPRIETLQEKRLVGKRQRMSLANNKTNELWRSFRLYQMEVPNMTSQLISLQIYDPLYFKNFEPTNEFEKWAAIEVADFSQVPIGMETFVLRGGLYAIFNYTGLSSDNSIFQYVFGRWLPSSNYVLDDRPHFEILGEKYKNDDPTSEEEICIPIRLK